MVTSHVLRTIRWKDGHETRVGTQVSVYFAEEANLRPSATKIIEPEGIAHLTNAGNLHRYLSNFGKPPTIATMKKWMDRGIARTITGQPVEPDGYGPDGSPSWLLVLGFI